MLLRMKRLAVCLLLLLFNSVSWIHGVQGSSSGKDRCPSLQQDVSSIPEMNSLFPMWSKGFARICCDVFPDKIISNGKDFFEHAVPIGYYDPNRVPGRRAIQSGDVVYVPSADLPQFILTTFTALPKSTRIILVSGCEDIGVPYEMFHPNRPTCADFQLQKMWPSGYHDNTMMSFIRDERLVKWFTQNYDGIGCNCYTCSNLTNDDQTIMSQKVIPIPIGLDLHGQLGVDDDIPNYDVDSFGQFRDLSTIRLLSLPFHLRTIQAIAHSFDCNIGNCRIDARGRICQLLNEYSNDDGNASKFHVVTGIKIDNDENNKQLSVHDRTITLPKSFVDCRLNEYQIMPHLIKHARTILNDIKRLNNRVRKRWYFWLLASASPFTITPSGGGLDTHRLWEAMQLGSVPITLTSTMDRLYSQYPIIIVNHWEEILQPNVLDEYRRNITQRFGENPFNATMLKKLSIWHWKEMIQQEKTKLNQTSESN